MLANVIVLSCRVPPCITLHASDRIGVSLSLPAYQPNLLSPFEPPTSHDPPTTTNSVEVMVMNNICAAFTAAMCHVPQVWQMGVCGSVAVDRCQVVESGTEDRRRGPELTGLLHIDPWMFPTFRPRNGQSVSQSVSQIDPLYLIAGSPARIEYSSALCQVREMKVGNKAVQSTTSQPLIASGVIWRQTTSNKQRWR
jgi:hypothetical protein